VSEVEDIAKMLEALVKRLRRGAHIQVAAGSQGGLTDQELADFAASTDAAIAWIRGRCADAEIAAVELIAIVTAVGSIVATDHPAREQDWLPSVLAYRLITATEQMKEKPE
jgi:hypothetical protein